MAKIIMVIRVGKENLSVHSKFVVPSEDSEVCLSSIAHNYIGSKDQLKSLAEAHAKRLSALGEKGEKDLGFYLYDKTPIEIWNGFGVIDEIPAEQIGFEWVPSVKLVRTRVGYNMPLDGDDLQFFLREFRKALN